MISIQTRQTVSFEQIAPIVQQISIFGGLQQAELESVISSLELIFFKKGATIFSKGEAPDSIYIIKKGAIAIHLEGDQEHLKPIVFTTGDCIGEAAFIGILPHSATTETTVDTELIILTREAFMNLFENEPRLFSLLILNIARETSRRLHSADKELLEYARDKHENGCCEDEESDE